MMSTFNFVDYRRTVVAGSIVAIIISLTSLLVQGLNLGLDFTGGRILELHYEQPIELSLIRHQLNSAGYEDFSVQHIGNDQEVLIRLPAIASDISNQDVLKQLKQINISMQLQRSEFIGAQIGSELRDQGGLALLVALLLVALYIGIRFQFKFSIASVVALLHDVIIVLGVFSLFQLKFDLTSVAALLAVIGYSLNDTIVVSDRIRENFRLLEKRSAKNVINISLNQTLHRTLITSWTTLMVLLALLLVSDGLVEFSIALIVGILVGTYSSLVIVVNVLLAMDVTREDVMPPTIEEKMSV